MRIDLAKSIDRPILFGMETEKNDGQASGEQSASPETPTPASAAVPEISKPVIEVNDLADIIDEPHPGAPIMPMMAGATPTPSPTTAAAQPSSQQAATAPASAANPIPAETELPEPGEQRHANGWTCPKCPDKTYEYRSFLLRHIKRVHAGEHEAIIATLPTSRQRSPKQSAQSKPDFSDLTTSVLSNATGVDYKMMAGVMFDMSTGILANSFGPEWLPRQLQNGDTIVNERDMVVSAIASYMRAKEVKDIPPGVMLTLVACSYSLPRLQVPSTKSKIVMGFAWLKSKFTRKPKLKIL